MLQSARKIDGCVIHATDGDIGSVEDLYFDDHAWTVRYLVADLGNWLPGRQVLVSPQSRARAEAAAGRILFNLTGEQIRNSPDVATALPMLRNSEAALAHYYGWPTYWTGSLYTGMAPVGLTPVPQEEPTPAEDTAPEHAPHLRSFRDVCGYRLQAMDRQVGHFADLLIEDRDWSIRYIEIDTRNWLPGRKVLMPPKWALEFRADSRTVGVAATSDQLKSLPRFDGHLPISSDVERELQGLSSR
jgi:hypothetical protein